MQSRVFLTCAASYGDESVADDFQQQREDPETEVHEKGLM